MSDSTDRVVRLVTEVIVGHMIRILTIWIALTIAHQLAGWPLPDQPWWVYVGGSWVLGQTAARMRWIASGER